MKTGTKSQGKGPQRQDGHASLVAATALAVATGLALIGGMIAMMAWAGGDHHAGMMIRGSSGADQTPVVLEADQVTVEMRDYQFFPAKLTVNAGTTVTWVNRDSAPHDAVASEGAFNAGRLDQGESGSVLLDLPGVYEYLCTFHPDMKATITVR